MKKIVLALLVIMLGTSSEQSLARWWGGWGWGGPYVGVGVGPYWGNPYWGGPYWGPGYSGYYPPRRRVRRVYVEQPARQRVPTRKISSTMPPQQTRPSTSAAHPAKRHGPIEKRATEKVITPNANK